MLHLIIQFALLERTIGYIIVTFGVSDIIDQLIESEMQSFGFQFYLLRVSSFEELKSSDQPIDLLFLDSTNKLVQQKVVSYSNTAKIPTVVFDSGTNSEFFFFTKKSEKCLSENIKILTNHLKLDIVAVVLLNSERNLQVLLDLDETSTVLLRHLSFLETETSREVSRSLNKIFKTEGIQNYVFLADENYCEVLSEAFEISRLDKEGNVGIFTDECIYQVKLNNSIILSDSLTAESQSKEAYYRALVSHYISVLSTPELGTIQIAKKLQNLIMSCNYSITNVEDNALIKVGSIYNNTLTIKRQIYTYGGLVDRSNYTKPNLVISANTGSSNPPGISPVFANKKYQEGTYFAVDKINRDHSYFEKFDFELYDKVDCGVSVFDYNYSKECILRHREHMGLAHIPVLYPITPYLLSQMSQLNIDIPNVGAVGSSGLLTNKTAYPYFVRIASPSADFAVAWTNLINIYGWDKIVTIVSNDSFGVSAYQIIYDGQSLYKYNIINDESKRIVPNIYNNSTLYLYKDIMQNIIDLGCNIILLLMVDPTPFFLLEGFYDLGVRRGDFTFIFLTITGIDALYSPLGNYKKRSELMHGSFVMYNGA